MLKRKRNSKLSKRITWRVIGIMVFFNVLIIGAILVFVFLLSLINSDMRGQHVTDGISGKMENMLKAVSVAAKNNVAELEDNIDSPEKVFDTLDRMLQLNNSYVGCFAAFEPDYFKSQGRWFEAYAYHTDSIHTKRQQIGSPQHDYFEKVWYKKASDLEKDEIGYLTDPYYDDSVISGLYLSYVMPIHDREGRKVGVYGIDLNLNWIIQEIESEEGKIRKMEFPYLDYAMDFRKKEIEEYLHILIVDSNGNRIAGSDSIDTDMLKGEQEIAYKGSEIKDLKSTPYYINSKLLGRTGWTLVVLQHYNMVFMWGMVIAAVILFFMVLGSIVIFFFTSRSIRTAIKPLRFLSASTQEVAKGNFDAPLPSFTCQDEVAQLRDSFDTMQQSLKKYVEELKESTASRAAIESELNVAHEIQMSMLPKTFPPYPDRSDIEIYGSLTPAKAVGGDLYDFFIRDEKLFFCIGDVSGKGVPASLVMAVTRTLFRNVAAHTAEPSHIMMTMNTAISEGNDKCMFVTLFVGVLDLTTGCLRCSNAGHEPPYIQGTLHFCDPNFPIGLVPNKEFSEQEIIMEPGSTIFLYTDGLTEAENVDRKLFGRQRITDAISAFNGSPQELIEMMTSTVHQYIGNTEQSDDLTMLAIRYIQQRN